ncbi:MAG: TlyA family RNA methyltransferase [Acidimicrobiia bacterium]
MVRRRLVSSRSAARVAVEEGRVRVDGMPAPKVASLVEENAKVAMVGEPAPFVSRGGEKLEGALTAFGINVTGSRCLDAGASTGGFTDCLLQRGAAEVVAVDVGYGQLDWKLRQDERVTVIERTNIRTADPTAIGAPFDVIVADLSFISLATVAPALASFGVESTQYILLVKPQFEAGKGRVGKGGVVRDPAVHRECVENVAAAMASAGYPAHTVVASSLVGPAGNREFLVRCSRTGTGIAAKELEQAVAP